MIKSKLKNGLIYYIALSEELIEIDSPGICDECHAQPSFGYLVPVLNHFQCPRCFGEWAASANHYPEDDRIEQKNIEYYESCILIDDDLTENGNCVICGAKINGHGNNAEPVKRGECCDSCNSKFVIPARIEQICKERKNQQ